MLSTGIRIWVAFEAVDMRLSFDGLAARVQHALGRDPYSGECFVFRGKSAGKLKMLIWDGLGFWIHYRRLEKASFVWPAVNERGMIELSQAQFAVLTQGLDWRRVMELLLAEAILHADETPVPVLDPGAGKTATGYLWAEVSR